MNTCKVCGTHTACDCDDRDDWWQAAKDIFALIGVISCVLFVIGRFL